MKKKLSVITGGSSGLGLASAQCLADKTALLLCARSEAGLAAAKKELETYGAEVYTFRMDASDEDSVKACAHYAASLGEIVNVIHTAGVSPANTAAEDILRINAMGPIYITEYFRPLLAEGGVLMLFSSTAGYTFETNEKMGALLPLIRKLFSSWQEPGFPARQRFPAVRSQSDFPPGSPACAGRGGGCGGCGSAFRPAAYRRSFQGAPAGF